MNVYTILIVEDNDLLRNLYKETLKLEGYRVLAAATLSEGQALLDTERPDLMLLDVNLHDGSGLDLCRKLRREWNSKIPVLIVSSLGSKKEIRAGYEAGCDDYLVKPFLNDELLARVKALIQSDD
jgi:DNA-binding response OmpR family regulator